MLLWQSEFICAKKTHDHYESSQIPVLVEIDSENVLKINLYTVLSYLYVLLCIHHRQIYMSGGCLTTFYIQRGCMLGGSTHSGLRVALSPSKGDGADALKR